MLYPSQLGSWDGYIKLRAESAGFAPRSQRDTRQEYSILDVQGDILIKLMG